MERPAILRMLPVRLRVPVFGRFFHGRHAGWLPLYDGAPLQFAPDVTMELMPGDVISDCIAFTGVYEYRLSQRLVTLARRGGTLIDVGANLGYFALLWTSCNRQNTCVAFEASPRNVGFLRRNINRNSFDNRIDVFPMAAGSTRGKVRFDLGPAEQTGWGGFALEDSARSIEVDVVRVDEVVRSENQITVLKIDVEGADAWVLAGCERLLKSVHVDEIWYEQNKPRARALGIPIDAAQDYLKSVGYVSTARSDPSSDVVEWSAVPVG
jgi:FkbM family methyltransferase